MLYVLVITLLLSGAALAAEYSARLRHSARSRWIWVLTIVASLAIPTLIASVSIQVPSLMTPTVSRKPMPLRELTSVEVVPLTWVHEHTGNIVATHNENRILQCAWVTVSVALVVALIFNGAYVFWRKRRWRLATVAGVTVYIAPDIGPAVVGLLRPRIVVPEWLAEASPSVQAMVIAHEQGHLMGYDPQLLTVALCLVVLMPWNFPLWWQLHRLRYAIEVDCDARVLERGLDTRQYGEMLIDVSQRPSAYIGAVAAMSEFRSLLEDRITLMVRDPGKWGSVATVVFGSLAVALVALAAQVTPPNVGSFDGERRPVTLTHSALDQYVGYYVKGANMVVRITSDHAHLVVQLPLSVDPMELVADSEGKFVGPFPPAFTFVRDAQGQTTELLMHYGPFSIPARRIDDSVAQAIMADNAAKARSQTPTPGSDSALRRLVDGIRTRKPNYDEMAPWFAELVRQTQPLNEVYVRWGAVRSTEFRGVDHNGGDVYEVRQEGGMSTWTIFLNSNGRIEDALNIRW
jgi:beta-lactamase regulating signal transducer with metallopeptidase domain